MQQTHRIAHHLQQSGQQLEKTGEENDRDVLGVVHWNGRPLFRDGHIQADKLGDSGPASCSNDEVVSARGRTVALDAATARETRDHGTDSRQDEEAADQAETSGAKS